MIARLRARSHQLAEGFLVVPGLILALFAGLAFALVEVDRIVGTAGGGYAFGGEAPAARQILSTIAGSLITVAGLTFSLTIVTLQLVSTQFTPRALRGLLSDRVNQIFAGSYVGIFVYSLLVLRTVRGGGVPFVPSISITFAIVAGVAAFALLLLFVHRMAQSIKLETIAARVARGTLRALGDEQRGDLEPTVEPARGSGGGAPVYADRPGYVQAVSSKQLGRALAGTAAHVKVLAPPGTFVTERTPLARVMPADLVKGRHDAIACAFVVADDRDLQEDAGYGLRQLADIALKALSPGVNDPTTATTCIHYLQGLIEPIAANPAPPSIWSAGDVTIESPRFRFEDSLRCLRDVGRSAQNDASVLVALLGSLTSISAAALGFRPAANARIGALVELGQELALAASSSEQLPSDGAAIDAAIASLVAVQQADLRLHRRPAAL